MNALALIKLIDDAKAAGFRVTYTDSRAELSRPSPAAHIVLYADGTAVDGIVQLDAQKIMRDENEIRKLLGLPVVNFGQV